MNDLFIVARKEIQEIFCRKITIVVFCFVGVLLGVYFPYSFLNSQIHVPEGLQSALNVYTGFLFLGTALALAWGLIQQPFMVEKAEQTIETLLTTPLSLRAIWLGKTISIFVLSYSLALINGFALILILNFFSEGTIFIVPSLSGWLNLLVATPVLTFAFIALAGLAEMLFMQPRAGQFLAFIIFFIVYRVGLTWTPTTSLVGIIYGIVAFILIIIMILVSRFLARERIILSLR